jgi:hypothetical protein|tara:strand:- start:5611 stop:5919 length:309 start_codon:yes stop_codon:yes gene_type:complete
MAFAPDSVGFTYGDKSIIGCFNECEDGRLFEFSKNTDSTFNMPHKIWVTTPSNLDSGFRYGIVKKTVAYLVTDEDDNGPIFEKWKIKGLGVYQNQSLNIQFR